MTRTIKSTMIAFALLCVCFVPNAQGQEAANGKSIATEVTIEPKKWSVGRLRNVPAGALGHFGVEASNDIVFMLLTHDDFKRFPKVKVPMGLLSVSGDMTLSLPFKETGHYYMLFWNREGTEAVDVKFFARIERK